MGVFDLPAKAAVLCAKQYNGEYGCSVCLHPGKRLPNNARVYLPNHVYAERTHAQVVAAGIEAERSNICVQGVFAVSPLASILDMVASFPIDYKHCVLEGVTRWLMNAWFDSKNHAAPYYVGRRVRVIDIELMKQQPPNEFSRPPCSIKKHFKYWKASELRYWLLFYSLPLYFWSSYHHFTGIIIHYLYVLYTSCSVTAYLDAAEQMLMDFYIL